MPGWDADSRQVVPRIAMVAAAPAGRDRLACRRDGAIKLGRPVLGRFRFPAARFLDGGELERAMDSGPGPFPVSSTCLAEMSVPASPDDLFALLEELGIVSTTTEHPALFTVAQSRELRGELPGLHSKNLFLKDKKGRLFLVTAKEDAEIDLKRLHERIGASGRLSFGSAELLLEVLGVTPGSVTPFALINDQPARVAFVIDRRLAEAAAANFHPLVNTATTTIAGADLLRLLAATGHAPQLLEFSSQPSGPHL